MLVSLHELVGYKMEARDGEIGKISDFLFDQEEWVVRYVADKTASLFGKEVIISSSVIQKADWREQKMKVDLDREQVKQSPKVSGVSSITHEQEQRLADHYNWVAYSNTFNVAGGMPITGNTGGGMLNAGPAAAGLFGRRKRKITRDSDLDTRELHSSQQVIDFKISTKNGDLGYVEDFIVDERDWSIRFMVIDTRKFMEGKKILVAPESIDWISWRKKHVSVNMEKEKLQGCPNFELSLPLKDEYAKLLYEQYECAHFWEE